MKGIILAGGHGTRLYPLTVGISKQLIPIYDKPMIYYPLSMLMLAGIQEILIICMPDQMRSFQQVLGDGNQWGLSLEYKPQPEPRGLADAFLVGKEFIGNEKVCLILGDNMFFGHGLPNQLQEAAELEEGAKVFAYNVSNPNQYGVIEFDEQGKALSIEEKPEKPRSSYAVPGVYFFDEKVVSFAEALEPSSRGELEITDLINKYLGMGELHVHVLGRGVAWLDAGTHDSLLQASNFVQAVEQRQGMMISCLEEIAFRKGYINKTQLEQLAQNMGNNRYQDYLMQIASQV